MTHSSDREVLELHTILNTMAGGLFVLEPDGAIVRWNRAMETITGYSREEVLHQSCSLLRQSGEKTSGFDLVDCEQVKVGAIEKQETVIRHKDGHSIPVLISARALAGDDGGVLGAVVSVTDISSLKSLENEVNVLRQQVEERYEFHNIVGKSHAMQELFNLLDMAAQSQATVLIHGETGTGKELVAKAIHYHSDRREGPLVTVNCAALSESLLESELFGHVRGAFTGAVRDHEGRFERADGGTIFLDEVGDIPALIQVKLLRVLQEREFERVGESAPRKVDVRVIAATHRDLRELTRRGTFREDLFYRLRVFPIQIPPLRQRKEDIPLLVSRFIERFNRETGKEIVGLTSEAMLMAMDYCWPGNVRELENAIEHAFVTCQTDYIGPFDLPVTVRRAELQQQVCNPDEPVDDKPAARRTRRKRPPSKDELEGLLDQCDWNKAEVARRLGVARTSVWRRMKKLGLPLEPPEEAGP